jgi:D-beta-D-heptose 7-phosphate kinase/D-beta-D-heptose 1-phosphate adenosyltransferase
MEVVASCDVVVISDYAKGVLDADMARELITAARARGIPVVVDPKPPLFMSYYGATLLTPNRGELEGAIGSHFTVEDDEFEQVRRSLGAEHLLVTLGADGMALATEGEPIRTTPSIAREVFDVSGAGDTVTAWTAAVLGVGGEIGEGAWLANLAAGVEVGKRGTATVSPAELLEAWDLVEQPE